MKEMKTLKFPNQEEAYEIVDAYAREQISTKADSADLESLQVEVDSHTHSASDITSGTLPVANGGTGVTTIDALKTALGVSSGGCQIETGSYTGAGSNSKTLTFSFVPKLVIITGYLTSTSAVGTIPIGVFINSGKSYSASHLLGSGSGSDSCKVTQSWSNKSVTLSVSASGYQPHINGGSYTYNYAAIG